MNQLQLGEETMVNAGQTTLDPIISNIPWSDAFEIGLGVNAVTGAVSGNAVRKFKIVPTVTKKSQTVYKFIKNESDMQQEVEVSASGKYNMDGVNLQASTSFLQKVQYSERSVTLIAKYKSQYANYEEASKYELTEHAKALIKTDPEKFRSIYGDYFVGGRRLGSEFVAIFVLHAQSSSSMTKFMASFGADAPDVFSAEGSAKFEKEASSNDISIQIDIVRDGYKGVPPTNPTTPSEILKALQWFQENESGVALQAKLFHYSTIDSSFSPDIPIAPKVFVDLRQIYTSRWTMLSLFNSIPPYYQKQLSSQVNKTNNQVMAYTEKLATDEATRQSLFKEETALINQLNDVQERQEFYFQVKAKVNDEPSEGTPIIEKKGGQTIWLYGFQTYSKSDAVNIQHQTQNAHQKWHIGHRQQSLQFGPNQNFMIVGWKVTSNWGDGTNGSWWKNSPQILLNSYGDVEVRSKYDRGFDWTVTYYFVDKANYEFGDNGNALDSEASDVEVPNISIPITDIKITDENSRELAGFAATGQYLFDPSKEAITVLAINVDKGNSLSKGVFYRISADGMPTDTGGEKRPADHMRLDKVIPVEDGCIYYFID